MIPNIAHFVWLGPSFPWVNLLSVQSALSHGKFERAIVHHDGQALDTPYLRKLAQYPGVELRTLDLALLAQQVPANVAGAIRILDEQPGAAARSDILRKLILVSEGGVYLDIDTVTVRPFDALRVPNAAFYGVEPVAYPGEEPTPSLFNPLIRRGRSTFRGACCALPNGWRHFRRYEARFPQKANGAILGAEKGSEYVIALLEAMIAMTQAERAVPFSIGPYLLQRLEAQWSNRVEIVPSSVFFPLGPKISEHWFRIRRQVPALDELLFMDTVVAHWYASNATREIVKVIDESYVREHCRSQLFSALATAVLDGQLF